MIGCAPNWRSINRNTMLCAAAGILYYCFNRAREIAVADSSPSFCTVTHCQSIDASRHTLRLVPPSTGPL